MPYISGDSTDSDTIDESELFNATIWDGFNEILLVDAIKFTVNSTPIVTEVTPKIGDFFGNYNLTLKGLHLNAGAA